MNNFLTHRRPGQGAKIKHRVFSTIERFMHIEAVSGIVLLVAAGLAIFLANSSYGGAYEGFWQSKFNIGLANFQLSMSLHELVNDGFMTFFFFVVGLEIRREMHEGVLSNFRQAVLPFAAAIGGVTIPALLYLFFNHGTEQLHGWAIPTATDIAFALGVLALLGKFIPDNVRIILLALAVIDDIIAVLIIALFYSSSLHLEGFYVVGWSLLLVLAFQWLGVAKAWAYLIPGALMWYGFEHAGIHASLAGVVIGLLTPVLPIKSENNPVEKISLSADKLKQAMSKKVPNIDAVVHALDSIKVYENRVVAPVISIQRSWHLWVAYGVMPIFAFANAGISFGNIDFSTHGSIGIFLGVFLGLLVGKPLGIFLISLLAVKLKICVLPKGVNWSDIALIGFLGGIGFTMSIFVAMLSFEFADQLDVAKLAVLGGSLLSALIGLVWGWLVVRPKKLAKNS